MPLTTVLGQIPVGEECREPLLLGSILQLQTTRDSLPDYRGQEWRRPFWTQHGVGAVWTRSCHLSEEAEMGLAGPY